MYLPNKRSVTMIGKLQYPSTGYYCPYYTQFNTLTGAFELGHHFTTILPESYTETAIGYCQASSTYYLAATY